MDRRIYGLESEYGLICTPERRGGKALSIQNAVMYLFREIISGRMYPDVFLENGARFYQDIGCHPNIATPECDDVRELVTHDKAGERIIERLSVTAERKMRIDGFYGKISVFKNNTDTPGNTYLCHENYLMDRRVSFRQLASQLIPSSSHARFSPVPVKSYLPIVANTSSPNAPNIYARKSLSRQRRHAASSTRGMSRMPTGKSTDDCTLSLAIPTCPNLPPSSRWEQPPSFCA